MSAVEPAIDVFLCHNSADKDAIRAVNEVLRQQFDLSTFLDESTMVGGDEWKAVIKRALDSSRTLAVFLGANGWGRYQLDGEVLPAIARRRRDVAFRIVPVLL